MYTAPLQLSDKFACVHLLFLVVLSWLRVSGHRMFDKSVCVFFLLFHKVWYIIRLERFFVVDSVGIEVDLLSLSLSVSYWVRQSVLAVIMN